MIFKHHDRILLAITLFLATSALGHAQKLVKSEPASGARNVRIDLGVIRFHFDQDMKMNSWTMWLPGKGKFPPPVSGANTAPWKSPRIFELKVKKLEPDTLYAVQLNSARKKGFQTARDGKPLAVTVISFRTAPVSAPPDRSIGGGGEEAPDRSIGGKESGAGQAAMAPGQRFKVSRTTLVDVVRSQGNQSLPFRTLWQARFIEEVNKVARNRAAEVTRQVNLAVMKERDPQTGEVKETHTCARGSTYRIVFTPGGSQVTDARSGTRAAEEVADFIGAPLSPEIWPEGRLNKGQRWTYQDDEVTRRLWFMEARGGRLDLQVDDVARDPDSGLEVAKIRGKVQTQIQLENLVVDYQADVRIDLPPAVGVPLMLHFKGKMFARGTHPDPSDNQVPYTVSGDAEVYQKSAPAKKVVGGPHPGASPGSPASGNATFGYDRNNPVCVGPGPAAARAYLNGLRDARGRPLSYRRAGSMGSGPHGSILDLYILTDLDGQEYWIFVDHYHPAKGYKNVPAPKGLTK